MQKKAKCLLITSIFPPIHGGSAIVYENICQFAPEDSIHVLAPKINYTNGEQIEGWQEYDKSVKYPVHRIDLIRPLMVESHSFLHSVWLFLTVDIPLRIRVLRRVRQIVHNENIKVICIGELVSTSWVGILAKRWLGCKLVNYIHGEEITTKIAYRHFKSRRQSYLKQADAIVAVSKFTQTALIEKMGVSPEKITLITNGVNSLKLHPTPKNFSLLEKHKLDGKQIVLSVGRLVARKGFDTTIRALPQVLNVIPNAHYLLVGSGEYYETLLNLASNLGISQNITFAGRVKDEDLVHYYGLCDLFVMPNREMENHDTEGFGLVFLEANACGKAVIGGRAGGVVEAVENGENGLLVDGSDVDELADTIIKLLSDSELRKKIEQQGLLKAKASSSESRAHKFFKMCNQLVSEKLDK